MSISPKENKENNYNVKTKQKQLLDFFMRGKLSNKKHANRLCNIGSKHDESLWTLTWHKEQVNLENNKIKTYYKFVTNLSPFILKPLPNWNNKSVNSCNNSETNSTTCSIISKWSRQANNFLTESQNSNMEISEIIAHQNLANNETQH